MSTETLTNLTAAELTEIRRCLADSGCYWHHLWQDVMDGKRDDLDADACRQLSRRAWDLWQRLGSN